jgi:hypothetical protein
MAFFVPGSEEDIDWGELILRDVWRRIVLHYDEKCIMFIIAGTLA